MSAELPPPAGEPPLPDGVTAESVAGCAAAEVAAALTRAFEGYVVPVRLGPEEYERRFRGEHLDPFASRIYRRDGAVAAVVLIARRGWTSRVAAMAVAPEARRQGLGRLVMTRAAAEARARGDRALLLEVIEQNAPAVRLYTALGFRARRRLVGFRRAAAPAGDAAAIEEIDPLDLARLVAREGEPDLPWMLAPESLAAATRPARAYHLGGRAYALVGDPDAAVLSLRALFVRPPERRRGWGRRLLDALDAAWPGRPWSVTPIVPEGPTDGFFGALGWQHHEVAQLEMVLPLDRPPEP